MKPIRRISTTVEIALGLSSILCGHALMLIVTKGAALWFLGFVQLAYVLPAGLWARKRGYRKMRHVITLMAGLTLLLNILAWIAIFSLWTKPLG
ncbi:hypothetical protein JIR001_24430 [Polycladomyces abyssicola]|uniref:Uncharacterized protein n=1 Tax=Polycladomyces abyssicola TaxID=1125966 RepID=A0A8D5UIX7_9BACL|nr:hypothetical protein [Polycladomyces abyssicola]BCU82660.1 hypothetical protein JIR001_24430 [Polycladomyces abyssicola]